MSPYLKYLCKEIYAFEYVYASINQYQLCQICFNKTTVELTHRGDCEENRKLEAGHEKNINKDASVSTVHIES